MLYNLRCVHVNLSDLEQDALDKKVNRLVRHLHPPYTINITLQHDTHHLKGDVVTCRMNVKQGRTIFHAERTGSTIADALDGSLDAIKSELERDRDRRKDRHEN